MSGPTVGVTITTKATGSEGVQQYASNLQKVQGAVKNLQSAFVAVGAAALTFRQAFEFSREGAALTGLSESFDRVAAGVLQNTGLLEEMRAAVGGTIPDAQLMSGVLTLIAGASDELSAAFGDAIPQLLEVAKAANKLNPTLGDTTYFFQSLATGIKRGSPLIIDNLGITLRLGEAYDNFAATLGKSADELTAEEQKMAILNETLRAGNQIVQQVGGSTDAMTDSWDRLTVQTQNLTNAFKIWLAEGLEPTVRILSGGMQQDIQQAAAGIEDYAERVRRLKAAYEGSAGLVGALTGASRELLVEQVRVATEIAATSTSYDDYRLRLRAAGLSIEEVNTLLKTLSLGTQQTARDIYVMADAERDRAQSLYYTEAVIRRASAALIDYSQYTNTATVATDAYGRSALETGRIIDDALIGMLKEQRIQSELTAAQDRDAAAALEEEAAAAEWTKQAIENHRQALEDAARTGDYFVATLNDTTGAFGLFNETLAQMSDGMVYTSNLTDQQSADLERLQGAYNKTAQELRDYELGIKGANLSEEKRAENMAELTDRMGELSGAIMELESAGGSYMATSGRMTVNQDALNAAFFEAADAAGWSAEQLAMLGGALGLYSDEAIEAALKTAAIQEEMKYLAEQVAAGTMSIDDAVTSLQNFTAYVTGSGAQSLGQLADGFIGVRDDALQSKSAIEDVSDAITGLPLGWNIDLTVDNGAAIRAIQEVQDAINQLGEGGVGGYQHPDVPTGGGGAGGVGGFGGGGNGGSPNPPAGGGGGGGFQPPPDAPNTIGGPGGYGATNTGGAVNVTVNVPGYQGSNTWAAANAIAGAVGDRIGQGLR